MPDDSALHQRLSANIQALRARRGREHARDRLPDRIADAVTGFTGSMTFVCLHLAVYGSWVVANRVGIPGIRPFDPSLVLLATEASVEAIFLSTFVLISQNRMAREADRRADLDLHINLLTEHEITRLARMADAIARKLDLDPSELQPVEQHVDPIDVLNQIEKEQE
ncbi:DUF1003 domain-containing protein [Sphingobium ummariense]